MKKYLGFADPVLPTGYAATLVELVARGRNVPAAAVLEGTEIPEGALHSPRAMLSFQQMRALVDNARRIDPDPALGLRYGEAITVSSFGLAGYALMVQRTLGAAIELGVRYHAALGGHLRLSLERRDGRAWLRVDDEIPLWIYESFVMEAVLVSFASIGRFLLGQPLPGLEVHLRFADPGHGDRYRQVLDAPVRFGAIRTALSFDAEALDRELRFACSATARQAEEQCEVLLTPMLAQGSVVRTVRGMLRAKPGAYPDMPALARSLQTSERSLRRALSEHGTSYQALLDESRLELAMDYLSSTSFAVEDIARSIGFGSGRAFRRAFKRWTGHSPSALRAASHGAAPDAALVSSPSAA